jgi:hypothetical protein
MTTTANTRLTKADKAAWNIYINACIAKPKAGGKPKYGMQAMIDAGVFQADGLLTHATISRWLNGQRKFIA